MNISTDSNIIKMVDRACIILEYLSMQNSAASISVLAIELDLPKANIYRILYTMQQRGLVEKEPDSDLYRLGKKLIAYGEKVRYDSNLVELAKPFMRQTSMSIGETSNIGINHEDSIVTLHSEEGEKSFLVSRLIPVAELHCSSMGKLYLSNMSEEKLESYFSNTLIKRTVNTIVDIDKFREEKKVIQLKRLAFDHEEYEYGLTCIAMPIYNSSREFIASISISGPTSRLNYKGIDNIINALHTLKENIESVL